jgi:hypothetical protein
MTRLLKKIQKERNPSIKDEYQWYTKYIDTSGKKVQTSPLSTQNLCKNESLCLLQAHNKQMQHLHL